MTGVLCMAYGAPADTAGIEPYFTHIRGGRPPSPQALAGLVERYRAIGGSPLDRITRTQARALGQRLGMAALVGMKHSTPMIEEAAGQASAAGITNLVGLPLAPHFAQMSLGGYESRLRAAWPGNLIMVRGFYNHPAFIAAVRGLLRESLAEFSADRIFFTAHSLPRRILDEGDPYVDQLLESCRLVTAGQTLPAWEFAFQSASTTGEPWLGPDLLEAISDSGSRRPLICPIGFVADHLEILFDIDIEARQFARERGLDLRRTRSFNDHPDFVEALAQVVIGAIESTSS